jgi:putative ABC transport system substrate-binding protein
MRRRDFVAGLGCTAAWPVALRAQQGTPVIGFLSNGFAAQWGDLVEGFRQGLKDGGYVEGRHVAVEYRFAEGVDARLPALAAELIAKKVAVIFTAGGLPPAQIAKAATSTIPIVFISGNDPVEFGLVRSLGRPEANLTGVSMVASSLGPKQLGLLRDLVPRASTFGLIINPENPNAKALTETLRTASQSLDVRLEVLTASSARELDAAFDAAVARKAQGLVMANDTLLRTHTEQIVALAVRHAMPVVYPYRQFVDRGGLMSYGTSLSHSHRDGAVYVTRILNGAKPADLPVQQVTKFELFINMKAAKALGITIPSGMIAIADELIE